MKIENASFLISNTSFKKCPQDGKPEFAFIGRSNVGKSSLINMLTSKKKLAKTSSTPGKTQLINHFIINEEWYLVDLPGYGFAKASKKSRQTWEIFITEYLLHRESLMTTFVLIDARLAPQKIDPTLLGLYEFMANNDGQIRLRPDYFADQGGMDGFFVAKFSNKN